MQMCSRVPAVAAVLMFALAGCGQQWQSSPPQVLSADVLHEAGMQYYWQTQLPLASGETVQRVYRLDENVYCITSNNRLMAVAADSGVLRWSRTIAAPGRTVHSPIHVGGMTLPAGRGGISDILSPTSQPNIQAYDAVIINSLTRVLVLDRSDGRIIRDLPLDPAASAGGASDGEFFYVPTATGAFYGLRLREGVKLWTLAARMGIESQMAFLEERVYAASLDGTVHAVKTGDVPDRSWTQQTRGQITAPLHVDGRGVFVGAHDRRLYGFNPYSGQALWPAVATRGAIREGAQVGQRTVFQYVGGDALYAVDIANGSVRWTMPQGRRVLAVIGGKVYIQDAANNLLVADEMLGRIEMTMPLVGLAHFAADTSASGIFTATDDGMVACIRLRGAAPLTGTQLRQR